MIEPRIYRAAFLPTLFAVVIVMFSLESRPQPLPQGLAADVLFDGRLAAATMRDIAERHPDRRPGSLGNAAVADLVTQQFRQRGFEPVVRRRFTVDGKRLENVLARKAGAVRDQIVLLAARDTHDRGPELTGSAADTAALLELARVLEGRSTRATIVVASVDGSSLGDAGARRLVDDVEEDGPIRATLVLTNLAASRSRGPLVVDWSNDSSRGSIGLRRTVEGSLRQELGGLPGDEGAAGQIARLAFPIGIGAQGVLVEYGVDAVRLSGSGELPPAGADEPDIDRFAQFGRTALRAASALDAGRDPEHGPPSYVIAQRNVLPGWALALLGGVLLLPPLAASIDAAARARRRRERLAGWWLWGLAGAAPFVVGLAVAEFLTLVGQAPDPPPAPAPPDVEPFDAGAAVTLLLVAGAVVVSWLMLRPALARRAGAGGDPGGPGAGAATAFALSASVVVLWLVNPFAALVLVPAVHCWMLATAADSGRGAAAVLVGVGLLAPAGVALYYLARLSLDPFEGAWYLMLLVTGHHVGFTTALLGCVLLGLLGSVVAIVRARAGPEPAPPPGPRLRGPSTYAGPGSLGGTESSLR